MKNAMRRELARQPFEEKVRKVGELIRFSRKIEVHRVREAEESGSTKKANGDPDRRRMSNV